MAGKPMTVTEMARMGGIARAKSHNKAELQAWGKQGGRPEALDKKILARLRALLAQGESQAECARILAVSVRTIGRAAAKHRCEGKSQVCRSATT